MSKDKKPKKCSPARKFLWYAFGTAGLLARGLTALALLAIAIKIYPIKQESRLFNSCVQELTASGKSLSASVGFCNGGN